MNHAVSSPQFGMFLCFLLAVGIVIIGWTLPKRKNLCVGCGEPTDSDLFCSECMHEQP